MTLISDKGTAFMSHVIKEVAGVLSITLKHATTKHSQTIWLLERSQTSIKQTFRIETGERMSLWRKNVSCAVLNYHTSYHTNNGCEPSRVFHGPIPYNILDIKLEVCPLQAPNPTSQISQDVLGQTEIIYPDVRENVCKLTSNRKFITTKSQSFKAQRSRLRMNLAAESRSSMD